MITKDKKRQKLLATLPQFTGTTQYYKYPFFSITVFLTEGAYYLVKEAECHWLIDAILSHQINPEISNHPELQSLQFWKLNVRDDDSASLWCEWDKDQIVETQEIAYTDFPLDTFTLYCSPTTQGCVIYLPSEY